MYAVYGTIPLVAAVLSGFKPVVVAIVIEAVIRIGRRALRRKIHFVVAALAFIGIYAIHVPFPAIVMGAAVTGLIGAYVRPDVFGPMKDPAIPRLTLWLRSRAVARRHCRSR